MSIYFANDGLENVFKVLFRSHENIEKINEEMKWHLMWRKSECYQALLYFPST